MSSWERPIQFQNISLQGRLYKVRYRYVGGRQAEESGFATEDEAINPWSTLYVWTGNP